MGKSISTRIALGCAAGLLLAGYAQAADLNGAWANDVKICSKLFVKKNNKLRLTTNSDFYGSGFIIDGDQVKGKLASCRIKSRKVEGAKMEMTAECATDIANSTDHFVLRIDGEDKITRFFPGMTGIEMTYFRCPDMK